MVTLSSAVCVVGTIDTSKEGCEKKEGMERGDGSWSQLMGTMLDTYQPRKMVVGLIDEVSLRMA